MTYGEWSAAIRTAEDELSGGELERLASAAQARMYGPGKILGEDIPWVGRGGRWSATPWPGSAAGPGRSSS